MFPSHDQFANVCGDGTYYNLGEGSVVTILYDVGNNVYPGDGAGTAAYFTAPVAGKYFFTFSLTYSVAIGANENAAAASPYDVDLVLEIESTTDTFTFAESKWERTDIYPYNFAYANIGCCNMEGCIDLGLGDTVDFSFMYNRGVANNVSVVGSASTDLRTFVSGYLVA